nr:transcription termination factor 2 [Hydra vulgaris]
MAGNLTEAFIKEKLPICPNHGKPCVLKTGTKNNNTYGKTFFICNNGNNGCSFNIPASDISATSCPIHKQMVELKAISVRDDGMRCYYRCVFGKDAGKNWCGHALLQSKPVCNRLREVTNVQANIDISSSFKQPKSIEVSKEKIKERLQCSITDNTKEFTHKTDHANPNHKKESLTNIYEKPINKQNQFNIPPTSELSSGLDKLISTDSNVNFLQDSFFTSRTACVSDISDASSLDSTRSSINISNNSFQESSRKDTCSYDSVCQSSNDLVKAADQHNNNKNIDAIEHVSISDKNKQTLNHITARKSPITVIDLSDSEEEIEETVSKERPISKASLAELQSNIQKQTILLHRIGPVSVDGGRKIRENIDKLSMEFQELLKKNSLNEKSGDQKTTELSEQSKMSLKQSSTINLEYNYPQSLLQDFHYKRGAPLFNGPMTQTKLKDVGRVTKEAVEQLHKSLDSCPAPNEEADEPKGLNVSLMTHQKQALAWLIWRERQIPSGGILADDMGLGKTLTIISLALKSKQESLSQIKEPVINSQLVFSKATLIICPASLVHQWHKEIERRVDKLKLTVCVYHGSTREKRIKKLASYDMVLTTYNIVSIEGKNFVDKDKVNTKKNQLSDWLETSAPKNAEDGPLFKIFWRRVVLDEGHTIKNHKSGLAISSCAIETESRWIVTGTPIQNKTLDLYSLIKFLRVSPFDEYKVWKREVESNSMAATRRLSSLVSSLLLRRTKDQTNKETGKKLVDLPKKSTIVHKIKLSEDESSVYDLIQKFSKNMFTQYLRKDTSANNDCKASVGMPSDVLGLNIEEALAMFGLKNVSAVNAGCILVLVLRLRQCCGHLSLMCEAVDPDLQKSEGIDLPLDEHFGNLSIHQDLFEKQNSRPRELLPSFPSTKIKALIKCLKDLQYQSLGTKSIKSVIVSQWTRMLEIVADHLKKQMFKLDFITGSVSAKNRSDIVEKFNNDEDLQILLISLKAGGVGLNLVGGSHLFLLDQHWNPALEEQACDRVYRVGQQNDVVIHRFLCENTVEERIVKLQEQKKSLANNVLYGEKSQKLTLDDLKMLFGISQFK